MSRSTRNRSGSKLQVVTGTADTPEKDYPVMRTIGAAGVVMLSLLQGAASAQTIPNARLAILLAEERCVARIDVGEIEARPWLDPQRLHELRAVECH